MIGRTVGHYRILEKLGEGGMGVVYRAEDSRLGRQVALKALPAEFARDPTRRERFQKEARAAAALNHAGIAAVYQLEASGEDLFIVFEYVRGETLRELISRRALKLDAVLQLAAQIADALAAAHAANVVHRDLKPENIIRTPEGQPKILDFGLARFTPESEAQAPTASVRLTSPGMVVGTVSYMSPEQLNGEEPDFRSDIFSFGVMLYELVTGVRPFDGPTAAVSMSRTLTAEPPPLAQHQTGVPAELERIVRKCLRKKPGERYQSTRDLAVDLQMLQRESGSVPAATSSAAAEPQPPPAPEDSDFLRQPGFFTTLNPRRWWEFHQITQAFLIGVVVYLFWLARSAGADAWVFPIGTLFCSVMASLRVYLLTTAIFNPQDLPERARAIDRWLGIIGFAVVTLLAMSGVKLMEERIGLATLLTGVAIAGLVNIFLLEPAIRRAAFPRTSEQRGDAAGRPQDRFRLHYRLLAGIQVAIVAAAMVVLLDLETMIQGVMQGWSEAHEAHGGELNSASGMREARWVLVVLTLIWLSAVTIGGRLALRFWRHEPEAVMQFRKLFWLYFLLDLPSLVVLYVMGLQILNLGTALLFVLAVTWLPFYQRRLANQILDSQTAHQ